MSRRKYPNLKDGSKGFKKTLGMDSAILLLNVRKLLKKAGLSLWRNGNVTART
jgi:hypothetical protein